jgi:Carboxypeptidase regulatory-like domain
MSMKIAFASAIAAVLPHAFAQKPCTGAKDTPLTGVVRDSTLALIPGATVTLDATQNAISASDGQFRFACVGAGRHTLFVKASGFSAETISVNVPHLAPATVVLHPEAVVTDVVVNASATPVPTATSSGPSQTISGSQLQSFADDPDDLLRELQQLSAAAGGSPSGATVAVDGFENGEGGTHLPPKSSIAYIKINPDLFSAEYREPPFGGGRIEIYTKPGQSVFHGALFATNSSAWMNAHDPFSNAPAAVGKQRYGFELTGPIRKQGSDFFTALEHRSISNAAVVNAITVNAAGVQSPILQTVGAPQELWISTAKVDWQLDPKNSFIASFDSFNNSMLNNGVGGTNLVETGVAQSRFDYEIHLTDVTTISPKIMHEARIGLEFDGYANTPNSTGPQISVAGAFTGGGATTGPAHEHEMWSSIIDDAIIQAGSHLIKVGIQPEFIHIVQHVPTNFNGTYTFGGGVTSTGAVLTGIQQYVNALNGAANGSPTTFSNVTGNPDVEIYQFRNAIYYQDDWKALSNLHFAYGLRYYTQTNPANSTGFQPRLGVAWSPDKNNKWSLHAHAGLFSGRNTGHNWAQVVFMDGVQRVTSTVYNPSCTTTGIFNPNTCAPTGISIHSIRTVQPNLPNLFYSIYNVGFSRILPKGFTFSADYYAGETWHYNRTENINSPTNDEPTGPRPYGANLNILQMQGSGRGYSNVEFFGLTNQALKRIQFFAGATRVVLVDDTDNNSFFTPQTTGVNAGEYSRRDGQGLWNVFGNATLNLPGKVVWSANYNGQGLGVYNVTTGFDNNGDGDFNDRPQYAPAGTPLCSASPNASPCGYATPWGELVTSGGIGSLPRNKGYMPWTFYLDTNVQRAFKLNHNPKAEHQQTLTVNIRSSNVLNHVNVNAVGGVLGSPLFGVPYAADNGRRVEGGIRFSF